MVTDNKKLAAGNKGKKRKQYLPHNKPVKKKGSYPLRPGVQGFFITCDGGRERQASHEAINVIDSFYEELVHGNDTSIKKAELPNKPLNKKIRFAYSDDDDDEEDDEGEKREEDGKDDSEGEEEDRDESEGEEEDGDESEGEVEAGKAADDKEENKSNACAINEVNNQNPADENKVDSACGGDLLEKKTNSDEDGQKAKEPEEPPAKKQCTEMHASKSVVHEKVEEKSVDKLIEEELRELGDKSKRRFFNLDSGCNGVVFVQMRKRDGDPSPKDIIQHMMQSAALTRKHMSRFILRVLPVEVACYASGEEISRAIAPLVAKYFPAQNPQKYAVLYEARANSGIERLKIIDAVAKSVPGPHRVDLSNPDKTIVVEIVKTVCLIGVVEKYKELAKYNLRQLTSPK